MRLLHAMACLVVLAACGEKLEPTPSDEEPGSTDPVTTVAPENSYRYAVFVAEPGHPETSGYDFLLDRDVTIPQTATDVEVQVDACLETGSNPIDLRFGVKGIDDTETLFVSHVCADSYLVKPSDSASRWFKLGSSPFWLRVEGTEHRLGDRGRAMTMVRVISWKAPAE